MAMNPTIAPPNPYPEAQRNVFERTMGPEITGNRGPLRFQEGVWNEAPVQVDFGQGAYGDTSSASPRGNLPNPAALYKPAEQTMQERAHVGSASWIEAPAVLSEFVQGAVAGDGIPTFEMTFNSGSHMNRPNPTRVDG